jgi:hypothetical protein
MVHINEGTGIMRPMQISDLYSLVQPLALGPAVPAEIRLQFDSARNAFIYSWFAYDLVTLAERQSYTVMEMALRLRAVQEGQDVKPRDGLKRLFDIALERGWLQQEHFEIPSPGIPGKSISLLDMARRSRNNLAHGEIHLFPDGSLGMMRLCAEIISSLFPPASGDGDA